VKHGATSGLSRLARATRGFAARFARGTRGNVAMLFALALPVLLMVSLGAIDIHQASKVKADLQDALDAAALAAARTNFTADDDLNRVGLAALKANMPAYFKTDEDGVLLRDDASFTLVDNRIVADARVDVKVLVANIILPPYGQILDDYLPVGSRSEVLRASRNVEVALVLDITGSMADGGALASLKDAAKELVSIVVQKEQEPFTSRVALVPYSMGVNLGAYADKVRGPLQGAVDIKAAGWGDSSKNISQISSGTFTATNHGLKENEYIYVSGVGSASSGLNNTVHRVSYVNGNTFKLASYSRNGSGGTFRRCWATNCDVVVTTSTVHTLSTGDRVKMSGVQGMTALNNNNNPYFVVARISDDQFSVGLKGPDQAAYSRGGTVQCGYDGCSERYFIGRNSTTAVRMLPNSTCVSERLWTVTNASGNRIPTDRSPGVGDWVGRNYPHSGNRCLSNQITPLTDQVEDSKTTGAKGLKSLIDAYQAVGSTAGQIGIEWGWYAVSPNFNSIWPSASAPNAYKPSETLKAVVLMTDGEFNNPYCQGVISRDAPTRGAGDTDFQINCSAPNGSPFAQSVALCAGMKKEGIVVYTVGFNLSAATGGPGVDTAREVMQACATSAGHFFTPNKNTDLQEAFKAIGRDITRLRIAR